MVHVTAQAPHAGGKHHHGKCSGTKSFTFNVPVTVTTTAHADCKRHRGGRG
jgi:hypothetical protein